MDVHEWHCNSKLYETNEDKEFNKNLENVFKHDPNTGTMGTNDKYSRVSFVCYLREKIIDCKEKDTKEYYKRIKLDPIKGFYDKKTKSKRSTPKHKTMKKRKE
jgi:hypothetical protein